MFAPAASPRLFGAAPGEDFPAALVAGLRARLAGQPPEAMARVTLYLTTHRMRRRVEALFHQGPPGFLPRLRLVAEAGAETPDPEAPAPPSKLARQLRLTQACTALIAAQPDLAAPSAAFDLAGGLADLMDEAQAEAVPLERILGLDVGAQSAHWERSLIFLRLVGQLDAPQDEGRAKVERLIAAWQAAPPADPVIVAGSTGSRGTTRALMEAVARLPQGALILPGFDGDMPRDVWAGLTAPSPQEDHPQYRFAALLKSLDLAPEAVTPWHGAGAAPDPARNRLLSLALRPAPVTDSWLRDGPALGDLGPATDGLTLIEAPDPRQEALALALRLRQAVEDGQRAALISPDRMLTRRVAAQLTRWGITPDDSAGEPLGQTALGRLLRQLSGLRQEPRLTSDALMVLLKSPLVAMGGARGPHLRLAREVELRLRRKGPAFPAPEDLTRWAAGQKDEAAIPWAAWLAGLLPRLTDAGTAPLEDHLGALLEVAERLFAGPDPATPGSGLWDSHGGKEARAALAALGDAAALEPTETDPVLFTAILKGALGGEVRNAAQPHPGVMIWGTLEARVQGADLLLLAGLNDGIWPDQPGADPWLNRAMRQAAGLLLPERRIGLSAHDFQQAAGAPQVVLSRAIRSAEAEAPPSRWLNRLTNLLAGLPDQGGDDALEMMRARGSHWLAQAARLDRPETGDQAPPAPRPAPIPPLAARPRQLSVTEVETLLRDPYQIYAKHVLRLRALDPLRHQPDGRRKGTVLHDVLHAALPGLADMTQAEQTAHMQRIAQEILARDVPWPTARAFWAARFAQLIPKFLAGEAQRRARGQWVKLESPGALDLSKPAFRITVKADRIDQGADGRYWVYDYKSGKPPTAPQQYAYNRQLHITALIAEEGGIEGLHPGLVAGADYIGLNKDAAMVSADFKKVPLDSVRGGLGELFTKMLDPNTGFPAQVARESQGDYSDYDHLSRGGEWDLTQEPVAIVVGDAP